MGNAKRNDGTTSRQIKEAPQGALFVWCNHDFYYPRQLAQALGRADLTICGPSVFDHMGERIRGRDYSDIVLDHAVSLRNEEAWAVYQDLKAWMRRRSAA